jgi:hypothetical protein
LASQLSDALGACFAEAVRSETPPISRQRLVRHQSHASEARSIRTSPGDAPVKRRRHRPCGPGARPSRRAEQLSNGRARRARRLSSERSGEAREQTEEAGALSLSPEDRLARPRTTALGVSRRSGPRRPRKIGSMAARRAPRRGGGPGVGEAGDRRGAARAGPSSPLSVAPRRRVSARGAARRRSNGGTRRGALLTRERELLFIF